MSAHEAKALVGGAALGAIVTAVFFSRFNGSWMILAAAPLFFALATLLVESFLTFDAGRGFGTRPGLGVAGWWCLMGAAFCLVLSFIT